MYNIHLTCEHGLNPNRFVPLVSMTTVSWPARVWRTSNLFLSVAARLPAILFMAACQPSMQVRQKALATSLTFDDSLNLIWINPEILIGQLVIGTFPPVANVVCPPRAALLPSAGLWSVVCSRRAPPLAMIRPDRLQAEQMHEGKNRQMQKESN